MFKIYGLIDPRDQKIFYVGRTSKTPRARVNEHLNESDKTSLKQQRIKCITSETSFPITYVVLEANILSEKQAFCKEVFWMETLIKSGAELTNASIDFEGTYFFREDTLESDFTKEEPVEQEEEIYVSASHNWLSDLESEKNDGIEKCLSELQGDYFRLEEFIQDNQLLTRTKLTQQKMQEKRQDNIRNQRLINHGFPILDEEISELIKRFQTNSDYVFLESYFQRSRKSLERLIEDHYLD